MLQTSSMASSGIKMLDDVNPSNGSAGTAALQVALACLLLTAGLENDPANQDVGLGPRNTRTSSFSDTVSFMAV